MSVAGGEPVEELPGLHLGDAGDVGLDELLRDGARAAEKGGEGGELRVQHRGGLADACDELTRRVGPDGDAVGGGELLHVGREVAALLRRALDDGARPHLGDGLVEARGLGEAGGNERKRAALVGTPQVVDDGLGDGLGQLVGRLDHDDAPVAAHGERVKRGEQLHGLQVAGRDDLLQIEHRKRTVHAGAQACDRLLALELVRADDEVGRQQGGFLGHGAPFVETDGQTGGRGSGTSF